MKRLLLVEDDVSHAELIARAFDAVPGEWTIIHASSLAEARAILPREKPTLVLADFRLPDGRGDALVELAQGAFPVVLLTAFGSEEMAVEVIKAGALDYIVKSPESLAGIPFRAGRVLEEWDHRMAHRKAAERLERLNRALLELQPDHLSNIQSLVALAGEFLEGSLAFYGRLGGDRFQLVGRWRVPDTFPDSLPSAQELCPSDLKESRLEDLLISNLHHCVLAPVLRSGAGGDLRSCLGHVVQGPASKLGILCVLFDTDPQISDNDRQILGLLASAVAVEETRRLAQEELRQSEARFRALFQGVPNVAVQGYTRDGAVLYWNRGSELLFGFAAAEAVGRNLLELIVPTGLRSSMREAIDRMQESGVAEPAGEAELVRQDGTLVPVVFSHAVVPQHDGSRLLFCLDVDLTNLRQAEQERLEMERRLSQAQKLESLGVLAGGIAHDFNNLLTSMLGNLGLALMDLSELAPARRSILEAERAVRRATELTQQMLAYSGRGLFQVSALDLSELIEEMAHRIRLSLPHNATLHLHLNHHLPSILADAIQIQQVVMNLLTNAAEALGEQAGSIVISTSSRDCDRAFLSGSRLTEQPAPGSFVCLEIVDTGCGMDATVQQRLFDPFFSTKFTGRGLGMSAVLGAVRGHRGAIFVESSPGRGASVKVLFPASPTPTRSNRTAPATSRPQPTPPLPPPSAASNTVLVADDEIQVRTLAERALTRAGFAVVTAPDGLEAVRLHREHQADIVCVILDLTMPNLDGVKACQEIRKVAPRLGVILASGYDHHELQGRFDGVGFAAFIQKPFEIGKLVETVREIARASKPAPPPA